MADAMIRAARERGIRRLYGEYRPSAKNGLVAELYTRLRFAPAAPVMRARATFSTCRP